MAMATGAVFSPRERESFLGSRSAAEKHVPGALRLESSLPPMSSGWAESEEREIVADRRGRRRSASRSHSLPLMPGAKAATSADLNCSGRREAPRESHCRCIIVAFWNRPRRKRRSARLPSGWPRGPQPLPAPPLQRQRNPLSRTARTPPLVRQMKGIAGFKPRF
uniref:Uncharacterized protein n=1 Tax=Sphaerodactylus townsendi TaxID=933632 RepID=A0ACB8F9S3_9SAUR